MSLWHDSTSFVFRLWDVLPPQLIATSQRHPDTVMEEVKRKTRKTCRIIAKHFLLSPICHFPRFSLGFFCTLLQSECHTFGFSQSHAAYYLFMFMLQKEKSNHNTTIAPSYPCNLYRTEGLFFSGRKFKMFTYLTNIHYHATYSHLFVAVVVRQYS